MSACPNPVRARCGMKALPLCDKHQEDWMRDVQAAAGLALVNPLCLPPERGDACCGYPAPAGADFSRPIDPAMEQEFRKFERDLLQGAREVEPGVYELAPDTMKRMLGL